MEMISVISMVVRKASQREFIVPGKGKNRRQESRRGPESGSGSASVADQELPEHVECSLEASHACFNPAHAVAEIRDVAAQALGVPARDPVHVEYDADDDGGRNPLERFRRHLLVLEKVLY